MNTLPKLYKLDSKNKIREWSIRVIDHGTHSVIEATSGLQDGGKVSNPDEVWEGKNIGRSNETTHYEQAVFQANAKHKLKLRSGYVENIADIKQGVLGSGLKAPMLAQKLAFESTKGAKTLEQLGILNEWVVAQPKLDGNRCPVRVNHTGSTMYTRKGDKVNNQLDHINLPIYSRFLEICHRDTKLTLDTEAYLHGMSASKIAGFLRNEEKAEENAEILNSIKLHIYDVMSDANYEERISIYKEFADDENIIIVPSYLIRATNEAIKEKLFQFIDEGYEGLILRTLNTGYENKRSWSLLKLKMFEDAEYELLDIVEESGRIGRIASFTMKAPPNCYNSKGVLITEFDCGVKDMNVEEQSQVLKDKNKYLNTLCTIRYPLLSEYGIPNHAKMFELDRRDV